MEPPICIGGRSHLTVDDGPAGDIHAHPEIEGLSLTPVQPMPYDQHDQHDTDSDLESADGRTVDTISTHSSESETFFSRDDESVVTGPTSLAPSSTGREDNRNQSITVSSFDRLVTVDLRRTSDTPRDPISNLLTMEISPGDDGASPSITPRMNWGGSENAPVFVNDLTSANLPESVREDIVRFEADLGSEGMSSTSGSGLSRNLVPTHTATITGISAVAKAGGSLQYRMMYNKPGLNMLSKCQMKEVLNPENLRDVCTFCYHCPSSMVDYLGIPIAAAESQCNPGSSMMEEVVNYLFEMLTQDLNGAAPKIRCWVRGPPAADVATLRFGLYKTIVLHNLQSGKPITFVCCDETFPSKDWARKATEAFLKGASPWAKAGLKFKQVDRGMPAHFRIAFSLFPKDLDCSVIAQAFFPGTTQPEERTLWVYLLAFHEQEVDYMAGYMGHEAGHIGGSRHGFDEHKLPNGSEKPEWKSVTMGPDNPKSVMNYHDDPADFVVQLEDIRDMKDMHNYTGNEYKGYKVRKVEPETWVYPSMLSFEFVMNYLLRKMKESSSPGARRC